MNEQPAIQPGEPEAHNSNESSDLARRKPAQQPTWPQRAIRRLPYTKAFKQRLIEEGERRFKEREAQYDRLAAIDDSQKLKFRREFSISQWELSQTETWIEAALFYSLWVIFGVAIPVYVVAPPLIAHLFDATIVMGGGLGWWALRILLATLTGVAALFILLVPLFLIGATVQNFFNVMGIVLCWGIVMIIAGSTYLYSLGTGTTSPVLPPYEVLVSFIIQLVVLVPLFLLTATVFRSFRRILERRRRRFHPREVIVDELLTLLREMEVLGFDGTWTGFSHRKTLTNRLEVIASCIENHFSQFFWTGTQEMDRWTDRDTTEMANGVRQLIKWIVAPYARTREEFKARIVNYFTAALASEWGRFDRVSPEKLSTRQGAKDRAVAVVTALLTAAVPVLLLLLLRRLNVISAEPLITYLTVGAYVWAALSLLSRVDPQYAAKLGALKDLTSTLPFGKKGGSD